MSELDDIHARYSRRKNIQKNIYSPLSFSVLMSQQELERELVRLITVADLQPVEEKSVLEVGCGAGGNLLQLIKLGFNPEHLVGNDLLDCRVSKARSRLPASTLILQGDACGLDLSAHSFDIVMQATVFSSILDNVFQEELANRMWEITKPGGGILWYDFIMNNPRNKDVRGVPVSRIQELFPSGTMTVRKLTLAPPISRLVTKIHPSLYTFFNLLPILRTHVLCWIKKP